MRRAEHHEWPLVFFTLLTQAAVGTFALSGLAAVIIPAPNLFSQGLFAILLPAVILIVLVCGALTAGLHLGRPVGGLFSLSNLRSSWLSREALLAGAFGLLVTIWGARRWSRIEFGTADETIILVGIGCGLGLVFGISRLYMLRTVPAWNHWGTPATFFTSSFLLGLVTIMGVWLATTWLDEAYATEQITRKLLTASDLLMYLLMSAQLAIFGGSAIYLNSQGKRAAESVRQLWTDFRTILIWRWVTLLTSMGLLFTRAIGGESTIYIWIALALIFISEIMGRYLFYGFYRRVGI